MQKIYCEIAILFRRDFQRCSVVLC